MTEEPFTLERASSSVPQLDEEFRTMKTDDVQPLQLVRRGATDPLGVGATSATLPSRRGETPHLLGCRMRCRIGGTKDV